MQKYLILAVRALVTAAFLAAGLAKLAGVEMMVGTFEAIGIGQWFRYVTGGIELVSAILLWAPGLQLIGAGLLLCTMICAVATHLLILGPSAIPALALGALAAVLVWSNRDQSPLRTAP